MKKALLIISIIMLITAASTIAPAYIDKRTIFENPELKAGIIHMMGKKFIQIKKTGSNQLLNFEKLVNEDIRVER
ncbi:hypothetical protein ACFLZT_04460 [Thermodesulfobacteriota bacterium]